VLFGQAGGLTTAGDWSVSINALAGDRYGSAVAIGAFDGVPGADLAVGAPGRDVGAADAGAVFVVPGASPGEPGPILVQGAGGVGGAAERGDRFGAGPSRPARPTPAARPTWPSAGSTPTPSPT
jgi:hypothetical protein